MEKKKYCHNFFKYFFASQMDSSMMLQNNIVWILFCNPPSGILFCKVLILKIKECKILFCKDHIKNRIIWNIVLQTPISDIVLQSIWILFCKVLILKIKQFKILFCKPPFKIKPFGIFFCKVFFKIKLFLILFCNSDEICFAIPH